ncbi:hypothetical protein FXO37_01743 [Capsicum annuum]|nr:hypothetical protein FXO37_01743 [Capsicum annuum]
MPSWLISEYVLCLVRIIVMGSFFDVSAAHKFACTAPMVPPTMGQPSLFPRSLARSCACGKLASEASPFGAAPSTCRLTWPTYRQLFWPPLIRGSHPYALLGMAMDILVPCLGLIIAIACTVLSSSLTSPHACALGLCFARVGQPSILGLCLKRLS